MKRNFKTKLLSLVFSVALMTGLCTAHGAEAASSTVHADYWGGGVIVEGEGVLKTDFRTAAGKVVPLFSYNGTVYIPLRTASSWLDRHADWNAASRTVSLSGTAEPLPELVPDTPEEDLAWEKMKKDGLEVQLDPNITITLDGKVQKMVNVAGAPVYPIVYQGTVYLPLRSIGELSGKEVAYAQEVAPTIFLRAPLTPDTQAALEGFLDQATPISQQLTALSVRNPAAVEMDGTARLTEIADLLGQLEALALTDVDFAKSRFADLKEQAILHQELVAAGLKRIQAGEDYETVAQENDSELLLKAERACVLMPQIIIGIQEAITQQSLPYSV